MLMAFSYIAGDQEGNPTTTAIERIEKYNRWQPQNKAKMCSRKWVKR
jgi:hypothetical protein